MTEGRRARQGRVASGGAPLLAFDRRMEHDYNVEQEMRFALAVEM